MPKIGDPIPCPKCDGDAEVWHPVEYEGSHFRECDACDGTGAVLDRWHRRAYLAISEEAGAVGWPKHFAEDLTVHDRRQLGTMDPSQPFAWILRESGTHIITLVEDGRDRAYHAGKFIRDCFGPGSWGDQARYYTWDGSRLREVADHEALARWADDTSRAIVAARKRAEKLRDDHYFPGFGKLA